jgi:predicted alpha/beta superfamily hydrolase
MPLSDKYLRFMVHELKPFVDRRYRTRTDRAATVVMGSSMGGLISLYAICEYPRVYGGAGCLSTHWPMAHEPLIRYLKERLPGPGQHRIYLDYGSEADHESYRYRQKRVERTLRARGYEPGTSLLSRYYPGDPHSETAWRTRVQVPLRFLLKMNQQPLETAAATEGGALVS